MSKYTVEKPCELLVYLFEIMPGKSKTTVKSYLSHRQVSVNNKISTQFNAKLKPGDIVSLTQGKGPEALRHPMLSIIYEDDYIIVIDKKNGLLSMGTNKEQAKTAYYILSDHVKKSDPQNRIFIVHRLDRETSGLMLFARSEEIQSAFQRNWGNVITERKYIAVIEGKLPTKDGEINAPLAENKALKVYVPRDGEQGEEALTRYHVLKEGRELSLVELELETGKKNQIRAHLEHMKTPIIGDKKYGSVRNDAKRVCLHARVLSFIHPITGEKLEFVTRIPSVFEKVVK